MEEIIHRWESEGDLALLLLSNEHGKLSQIMRQHSDPPELVRSMGFKLQDANGNRVTFPLELISDTRFH